MLKGLFEQLCEEIPTVLAEEYFENNRRPEPRKGNLFELWIEDNDFEIWMEEKIEEMWDTLKEEGYAIIGFFNLHNEVLL